MNRKEITKRLGELLIKDKFTDRPPSGFRMYWAREVSIEGGHNNLYTGIADYVQFKPVHVSPAGIDKGDFLFYEVKSSVSDFKSGARHTFLGDYGYYVMPDSVYVAVSDRIPDNIGVLTTVEFSGLMIRKRAKRQKRTLNTNTLLFCMMRSSGGR